jgi:hypothetical protein
MELENSELRRPLMETHQSWPIWLNTESPVHRPLWNHLKTHGAIPIDYTRVHLGMDDFFTSTLARQTKFSRFAAIRDSHFYSTFLEEVLTRLPKENIHLIDLCGGSAIPLLSAILKVEKNLNREWKGSALSLDIDPEAVEISEKNIKKVGLESRVRAEVGSIDHFLDQHAMGKTRFPQVMAINPPYLPYPDNHELKKDLIPVVGGNDGGKWIEKILKYPHPENTYIALEWSSLANPLGVLEWIESEYETLFVKSCEMSFGSYTSSPDFFPYLMAQRERGLSLFGQTSSGNHSQILICSLLRKKVKHVDP